MRFLIYVIHLTRDLDGIFASRFSCISRLPCLFCPPSSPRKKEKPTLHDYYCIHIMVNRKNERKSGKERKTLHSFAQGVWEMNQERNDEQPEALRLSSDALKKNELSETKEEQKPTRHSMNLLFFFFLFFSPRKRRKKEDIILPSFFLCRCMAEGLFRETPPSSFSSSLWFSSRTGWSWL